MNLTQPRTRRDFLRLIGLGAAATGVAVALPEPVRRFWQVGRNAPVGDRALFGIDATAYWDLWGQQVESMIHANQRYTDLALVMPLGQRTDGRTLYVSQRTYADLCGELEALAR